MRLLTMRGTIHLLTPEDAVTLRPWTQPVMDRVQRNHPDPRPQLMRALVQTPPRGTWKGSGGVVYAPLDEWVGRSAAGAGRAGDRTPLSRARTVRPRLPTSRPGRA